MTDEKVDGISFVDARTDVLDLISELDKIIMPIYPERMEVIQSLLEELDKPLFSIAVTGPSRVGKSTLINALLSKNVSPINIEPTTGIPCIYEPGNEDKIRIVLQDGKTHEFPLSMEVMEEWVSQQKNLNNEKGVQEVIVKLKSDFLKLGFSILDLPGLDDPSDNVKNMAELALETTDAIIYVMDASGYATGSFIFSDNNKKDLQRLVGRKDKTFIVLNKADILSAEQKKQMKKYLKREFKRFELIPLTNENMFFISAKNTYEERCEDKKKGRDKSFSKFESQVWDYLLLNNEIGRNRLNGVLSEMSNLVTDQVSIASIALARSDKVLDLKKYLVQFKELPKEIHEVCNKGYLITMNVAEQRIQDDRNRTIRRFTRTLNGIPMLQPLPSRREVKRALERAITQMSLDCRRQAEVTFREESIKANKIVQKTMNSLIKDINQYLPPATSTSLTIKIGDPQTGNPLTPFGGAIGLALAGAMFGPVGALIGGIVGFIIGIFVDETQRRDREVRDILNKSVKILDKAEKTILIQVDTVVNNSFHELEIGLNNRIKAASKRLRAELDSMGEPLPPKQREVIETAIKNLNKLQPRITSAIEVLA